MDQSAPAVKKTVRNIVGSMTAIVIILAPLFFSNVVVYAYINPKLFAIEIGLAVVIALALILRPLAIWKKMLRQPIVWGIGAFLLTLLVSTFTSVDPITSWFGNIDRGTGTFFFIILTIAAWAIGCAVSKAEARKYILIPISISGTLIGLSVLLEQAGWKFLSTASDGGLIGNTSMTGTYLLITFFITGYLLLSSSSRRAKWIYGIAMAVMVINTVFINFSFFSTGTGLFSLIGEARGATLSLLFGVVISLAVWGMTSTKRAKKIVGSIVLALAIAAAAGGIIALVIPTTRVHAWFVSQETEVRFIYWNTALKGFHDHPVLGSGPETYAYTYQKYFDPVVMLPGHSGEVWSDKPHNAYLQVLSETGVVGAIGYIALFAGFILSFMALYKNGRDRKLLAVMSGLLAAYLLNNVIFFDTVTSYFLFFMIGAFIISQGPDVYEHVISSSWQKILRIVLGLAIVATVLAIVIPQLVKAHRGSIEFTMPLDRRAAFYQEVENTSPYGAALFISQRADFSYESIFAPNLGEILQQNEGNRTIAANAIQGLIDTLQNSFQKYPPNEQGELAMGKLASIKMVILNAPDANSLATMKAAAEAAISISPTNPNGYMLLGQEYVYEQKYDDAFAQFDKARALEPDLIQPHMALINLANLIQDSKKAAFYIAQAKQESPDFVAMYQQ
jgi:O-antigen ligase